MARSIKRKKKSNRETLMASIHYAFKDGRQTITEKNDGNPRVTMDYGDGHKSDLTKQYGSSYTANPIQGGGKGATRTTSQSAYKTSDTFHKMREKKKRK